MKILIEEGAVVVQLSRWDRLCAARVCDVRLDLGLIRGVRVLPEEAYTLCKGFRVGTHVPWGFTAGTFYHADGRQPDFYFLRHADRTVAIELAAPAKFGLVVVEVGPEETPEAVAARIQAAVDQLAGGVQNQPSQGGVIAGTGAAKAATGNPDLLAPLLES